MSSSLTPVRTEQDGSWVPIDPTLSFTSDGTVAPAATDENVDFSAGGAGPLVTLTGSDGQTLSFSWPTPLPTPTLDGPTATYASVLPGVDLQVTATADSYSEVLVVHSAEAAANPELRQIKFAVQAHNLQIATDGHNDLKATDDSGHELFHASEPAMWDSSTSGPNGDVPTATDPGSGDLTVLPLTLPTANASSGGTNQTTMTLTPPADSITGPDVTYPVYIDPAMEPDQTNFAVVTTNNNWHYVSGNDLKVGDCDWPECNGTWKARTYLHFDTSPLVGGSGSTVPVILSAELDAYEIHNGGDCQPENVQLWSAGGISASTAWPGPAASYLDVATSNRGDTCSTAPAGDAVFNGSGTLNRFQAIANGNYSSAVFGLIAPDESNRNQWKRFSSASTGGTAAQIIVRYDFPPGTPYNVGVVGGVACNGTTYVTDPANLTLAAQAHDYNTPAYKVGMRFDIYNASNGLIRDDDPQQLEVGSDKPATWQPAATNSNNLAALSDGDYHFTARAQSETDIPTDAQYGNTSKPVNFTVTTAAPANPSISSFSYPSNAWGTPATARGSFDFSSDATAAGFTYAFDTGTPPAVPDTTCNYTQPDDAARTSGWVSASGGAGSLTAPNTLTAGRHSLTVRAFSVGHVASASQATYYFYVSPNYSGEGATVFQAESAGITDAPGQNYPGPCSASASMMSGGGGERLIGAQGATFVYPFTTNLSADYAFGIEAFRANHHATLRAYVDPQNPSNLSGAQPLSLNGNPVDMNMYSSTSDEAYYPLGGLNLTPGTHTLVLQMVSTSGSSYDMAGYCGLPSSPSYPDNGYSELLDFLRVVPVNNVSFSSFSAAMNNDGLGTANATGGGSDIYPSSSLAGIDRSQLNSALLGNDGKLHVDIGTADAATFDPLTDRSDGMDNVIATGQTIAFASQPQVTKAVDLLVLSTCGSTIASTSTNTYGAGVTYTLPDDVSGSGVYESASFPSVPDWKSTTSYPRTTTPDGNAVITQVNNPTLTQAISGANGTPTSSIAPRLFHVQILLSDPAQYGTPSSTPGGSPYLNIASVTLPSFGSDTSTCKSANLHVLAISFR